MQQMSIPAGQIMLAYQDYQIPNDPGLYIALNYLSSKVIGNNSYPVAITGGMNEIGEVVSLYEIRIDMMSFDDTARLRKEEIYAALRSVYAEQQMESNGIQIARMPSGFQDASTLEETKMLYRFTMTIKVSALTQITKAVEYYDQFPTPEVTVNE